MSGVVTHGLHGCTVALLGGDQRELELARTLQGLGAGVITVGLGQGIAREGVTVARGAREAVAGAGVIIAPVSGTDGDGRILRMIDVEACLALDEDTFRAFRPGAVLLVGRAVERVRNLAEAFKVSIVETAELDTLAWLNAVPTAEGAIMLAFAESPVTVAWSQAVVLGFGRCGKALATRLYALGASVIVVARRPEQQAEARAMGLAAAPLDSVQTALGNADFVFNTIPALVLGPSGLGAIGNPDALIVDVASAPGGVDFEECRALGLKALLAPGLPGRVAPKTAGKLLAEALIPVILRTVNH